MNDQAVHSRRGGLKRAFLILAAMGGLSACVAGPPGPGYARLNPPVAPVPGAPVPGRKIALLVPLTGSNAELGQAMVKAAQLALDQPGAPPLDVRDTRGTPDGASAAARAALDAGAGVILGPLTTTETAAVSPIARAAAVPMLAFTSDAAQAQPGVWTLGITAAQQVRRLTLAARAEGKTRIAAVLPQNPFGDAMANGLAAAVSEASLPEPIVRRYSGGPALAPALREVADTAARRPAAPRPDPAASDPAAPPVADTLPVPPVPFDALLLAESGETTAAMLRDNDAGPDKVRVMGPGTWARNASRMRALAGAWYAAPDPAARQPFITAYTSRYGTAPREFASLAFDAASVARVAADANGFPMGSLLRNEGFSGADGLFGLLPDGGVRRGLAIFEIDRAGAHIVQPAPQTLGAPGV